jgi:putative inorganic carbon (hco3(-)) transporter
LEYNKVWFNQYVDNTPLSNYRVLIHTALAIGLGTVIGVYISTAPNLFEVAAIIAGLIFIALAVTHLEIGLFALIFTTYIRLSDVLIHYHGAPSVAKPLVAFLFAAVLLRALMTRQTPRGWIIPTVLTLAYGVVIFMSLFVASDIDSASTAIEDYIKDAIIIVVIVLLIQNKKDFHSTLWVLMAAGVFLGGISSFQYLTNSFHTGFGGFAQSNLQHIIGTSDSERIAGPIGDPNFYAQVMLVLVPIAFYLFLIEKNIFLRAFAGLALGLTAATVVFTFSRGGLLALAAAMGLAILYRRPKVLEILLIIMVGIIMIRFVPPSYIERMQTVIDLVTGKIDPSQEVSFRGRTSELLSGWRMFQDYPILGVGAGNYPNFYQEYSRKIGLDPRAEARSPHNLFLEVTAETGIAGVLTFGALIFTALRSIYRAMRLFHEAGLNEYRYMAASLGFGFIGYLSAAVFIHGAFPRYLWLLVGVSMALPQAASATGTYNDD